MQRLIEDWVVGALSANDHLGIARSVTQSHLALARLLKGHQASLTSLASTSFPSHASLLFSSNV